MKTRTLDFEVSPLDPGLVGLVQGVAQLMDEDPDELLAISSAAFCNYVFDPGVNQHEDERREFSAVAALFSNYGPWESIAYYTGWEILEVNALSAVETLKVVVFELEHDRPMLTLTPDLEPAVVIGHEISVDQRLVKTSLGQLACRDDIRLQGDHEVFRNWLLLVRPGESPDWAATKTRQRINVVRWAVEHAGNTKEFFQETRENYVPGLLGFSRFREFLTGLTDPAGVEYAERYIRALHAARSAAATALVRWADPIGEALESPTVAANLRLAAQCYRAEADAVSTAGNFSDAMASAHQHEVEAVAALRDAVAEFPDAFEAL